MSIQTIFKSLKSTPTRRRPSRRRPPAWRLCLEALEDRCLLSFSPAVSYPAGLGPQAVTVADFNGDGRQDLAVVNYSRSTGTGSILLSNADGTFQAAQNFATGAGPRSLAVGDFNGDGKLDLVTANAGDVSVLVGNGNGTFQAPHSIVLPGQFPPGYTGSTALPQGATSVAVGDLNGDGKLDLAVSGFTTFDVLTYSSGYGNLYATFADGYVNVLLGNGEGSFSPNAAYHGNSFGLALALALGDFNGDGKLDVVAVSSTTGLGVNVLPGNGDGTLKAPVHSASEAGFDSVVTGDLNGDGKFDLVTRSFDLNGVLVQEGNGDGTFQAGQTLAIGSRVQSVVLGDVNGDGKLDITALTSATQNSSGGLVTTGYAQVLLGYGDGSLALPTSSTLGSQAGFDYYSSAALGDFNGDGRPDLAATDSSPYTVSVALNRNDWSGPEPTITIVDNVSGAEGNTGTTAFTFTVTLSPVYDAPVTVDYATADLTPDEEWWYGTGATAGVDYTATSGTVTFAAGQTSRTITVLVNGDRVGESDENFFVNLSNPTSAHLGSSQAFGHIVDDEPDGSIRGGTVVEGNSGTTALTFTVTLSAAYDAPVTVSYATADGSATVAAGDYQAASGTVTFAPGVTSMPITVLVNGDRLGEYDEDFTVNLTGATGASFYPSTGYGTIQDDEPRISINSVSLTEGNSGTKLMTFTVALSAAYDQAVTVNYATHDSSATAGNDYVATSGTLTFAPGKTTKTFTVVIKGDKKKEADESFYVLLSGASSNSFIDHAYGWGTILNDDGPIGFAMKLGAVGKSPRISPSPSHRVGKKSRISPPSGNAIEFRCKAGPISRRNRK